MAGHHGSLPHLEEILGEGRGQPKVLLVRSRPVGHQLLERLARGGVSWANVRVRTPGDLALELAAPELARRGLARAGAIQSLYLVDELVRSGRAGGWFLGGGAGTGGNGRPPGPTDGMVRAVHRSLMELRRHGVEPPDLERAGLSPAAKGEALARILAAYQARLDELSLVDGPGVLRLAVERLRREGPAGAGGPAAARYLIPRTETFEGLERELVEGLVGGRRILFDLDSQGPSSLDFFHAAGPAAELRAVLRRVMAGGIPLDQVEVAATDVAAYGEALHGLAARLGLLVTFADGLGIQQTAPGRGALAYLDWITGGYRAELLAAALAAGDLVPGSGGDPGPERGLVQPPPGQGGPGPAPGSRGLLLAQRLLGAGIGWGRARYRAWIDRVRAGGPPAAGREREPDGELDRELAAFLHELLAVTPEDLLPPAGGMGVVAAALRRVVIRFTVERSSLDRGGRAALLRTLEGLERVASGPVGVPAGHRAGVPGREAGAPGGEAGTGERLEEAAARLRGWLAGLTVGRGEPRPGALHFTSLDQAGYTGRAHLFVVGLDEGRFPGKGAEDPLLLDGDRGRLPGNLPSSGDRLSRRRRSLDELARRVTGSLTCSFTSRDPLDGEEVAPSPALLDLFRQARGRPDADYTALREALGSPEGVVPPGKGLDVPVLDGSEGWLAAMRVGPPGAERLALPGKGLEQAFPLLAAGRAAEAARASDRLTPYDGLVGPVPELDPRCTGRAVSAGRLEMLAGCPLRYFFRHVLEIVPPDRPQFDPDRWLDPLQRGIVLHEVYRRFLEERIRSQRVGEPVGGGDRARMEEIALEAVQEARRRVPPPSEATFERERRELVEEALFFVELEARRSDGGVPVLLERAFGMEGEPPLELELAGDGGRPGRLRLQGRIDRVDRLPDGTYAVWDYKTGSAGRFESERTYLDRGRQLQHVLYAWAAEELLRREGADPDPQVSRSGYLMTARRGGGQPLARPQDPERRRAALELVAALLDVAASGTFPAAPDAGSLCAFCDYRPACAGPEAARRAEAKAQAGDPRLAFWEEVRRYA